ncbi:hypothetical protein [Thiovibrio frasassiensis]|uniref:Uncharacterized protein n=1 Tax=Thiovibrio frasassiensis TaxID=2984131 RepID=A0A9X4MFI2_9BACT|nr:hypothetical protein [Thiovibrio frasassiensis]MDG4476296.1 hypothetical protein [Thiovibrio frasassiensis]
MTDRAHRTYFFRFILFGTCLVMSLGVFNLVVDPFDIFRVISISGVNTNKIMASKNMRMHKAYAVVRKKPRSIILGNSTAEAALAPEHAGFTNGPVYNLAIPGATMYEILRNFEHAQATRRLHTVLLSLDFSSFEIYPVQQQGDFNEERLTTSDDAFSPWISLYKTDLLSSLFSLEATKMSLATLRRQSEPDDCLDNGMRDWNILLKGMINEKGIGASFTDTEEFLARGIAALPVEKRERESQERVYGYLQELITICYRDDIRLIVLIPPNHVRRNVLLNLTGMGEIWNAWKRKVVAMNQVLAVKYGKEPFPVWDFSGPSSYTTELLPREGGKVGEMQWQWESAHYKRALGDLVLARVLPAGHALPEGAADFGEVLTSANIEAVFRKQAVALQKYIESHPQDVAELEQIRKRYRYQH